MTGHDFVALPSLRQLLAKLHLRLIAFAVAFAAASLLLSGMIVVRDYARHNLDLIASSVAYAVEPPLYFGNRAALHDGLIAAGADDGVARAEVRDTAGRVLAAWHHPGGGILSGVEWTVDGLLWSSPAIKPIMRRGVKIAEVRIYGKSEGFLRYALSGAIIALSCLGLSVFAMRLLAYRLQHQVIAPLDHAAQVAHMVRSERTFDRRVPTSGIAEIDRLGANFNALLAELQGWHARFAATSAESGNPVLASGGVDYHAAHDPLTGLGNRTLFEHLLAEAIGEAISAGASFAVVHIDAEGFEDIRAVHGARAAEAALVAVADRMRGAMRAADYAFRLGGKDFAVLLAPLQDHARIADAISRIERAMADPLPLPGGHFGHITLRSRVAVYPDDGVSPHDLLRRLEPAVARG